MLANLLAILTAVLFLGLLLLILAVSLYRRLVWLRRRCENALLQLAVQMQRRYALIPQLVSVAAGVQNLDPGIFETLTRTCQRAQAAGRGVIKQPPDLERLSPLIAAEAELDGNVDALSTLFTVRDERCLNPQLDELQSQLGAMQNRICFARETYNDFASHYNAGRERLAARLLARTLGFGEIPLFQDAGMPQNDEEP